MFIRNRQLDSLKKPPAKMVVAMSTTDIPAVIPADIPTNPEARWEWIKYQLRIRGSSAAKLAQVLKVTDRAIRATKSHPYPRIERAIAETLDVEAAVIWPERWNADGSPLRQRPNSAERRQTSTAKNSRYCPVSHRKTGTEA
jgi:Ner family transcriptional regulator